LNRPVKTALASGLGRRAFLASGGALVIGFSLAGCVAPGAGRKPATRALRDPRAGPPDAKQLDTWLAIQSDNTATLYTGFAELGQGNTLALMQVAAEELDLDMDQIFKPGQCCSPAPLLN
jgi:CO/xanthine dehydrogenase Mo-binding subunit